MKLRDILKLCTLSIKCFDIDVNNKVCFLILGIEIKSQVVLRIYATVLGVVYDAPARCMVQNFVRFNGKYGCSSCLSAGENLLLERGQVHIYSYDLDNQNTGHADLRSHTETEKSAKKAEITQSIVNGVKGYTPLYELPLFDMIRQVTVDYMHCVLLGVMKKMINFWTNATFKKESNYIGQYIKLINSRILRIKPPNIITRLPHAIDDLANLKASQYRSFLLFYSLPCLVGVLKSVMFHCKEYTQVHCRNSFTVKIDEGKNRSYGQIEFFLKVLNGESCDVYLAVIEKFELMHRTNILPSHMSEVSRKTSPFIVPVSALSELCVFLPGTESDYIAHFPNTFERD